MAAIPHSGVKRKLSDNNNIDDVDVDMVQDKKQQQQLNPAKRSTTFQRPQVNDIPFVLNPDHDDDDDDDDKESSDSQYEYDLIDDNKPSTNNDDNYAPITQNLNQLKIIHKNQTKTQISVNNDNDNDDNKNNNNNNNNNNQDIDLVNNFINDVDDDLMIDHTQNNNNKYQSGVVSTAINLNWSDDDAIEPYESDDNKDKDNDNDIKTNNDDDNNDNKQLAWFPTQKVGVEEEMKYDKSAYNVLFEFHTEWPCLSFDIISDNLGGIRTSIPYSMYLVTGTQADPSYRNTNNVYNKNKKNVRIQNKIQFLKLNDIQKTKYDDDRDNILEENDNEFDNLTTDDPQLQNRDINHPAVVNRIRVKNINNNSKHFVATFSDDSSVYIYDGTQHVLSLDGLSSNLDNVTDTLQPIMKSCNSDEGFGLSWCPQVNETKLLSGSCVGELRLYRAKNSQFVRTIQFRTLKASIEDIQWSPQHSSIFLTVGVDKCIRLWDIRNNSREHCARIQNAHKLDINVCSWNPHSGHQHLLLTGSDDNSFKIWDLRKLTGNNNKYSKKLKKSSHYYLSSWHVAPITSIEWHPHDSSSAVVSSEDNQISIWDFSLENDNDNPTLNLGAKLPTNIASKLPPQLIFIHGGQNDIKEVHFHKQIPNMLISTSANGFHIFQPDNLMQSFRNQFSNMNIVD